MWIAVNSIGLAVVAVASVANNILTRRKVQEVKKIVDGPLSVALRSNADLAARIASLTGAESDVRAQVAAETLNRNREEGKQ